MSVRVSVVVPVYNPGTIIDPCIHSLLAQSLPACDLELIFVDDGSSDDTLDRLQDLAAAHGHVRVISIPNSGWPGKPRNVGTDAAQGSYVMYVDQDDRLDPEALERMHDLGSANDADIILGKVTSDFRGVHQYLYREQRARCTVYDARLINSQTPHKMLRRQFMIDNQIRYPEGRRRLEDQLFMTKAYFTATTCSIVADYVCYRYLERPDQANSSRTGVDHTDYYKNLRDVLDVVDEHVPPGPLRDHFYRRFYRVEMLGKLAGARIMRRPPTVGELWLRPIRQLAEERFPLTVDDGLPVVDRIRADLMRHGSYGDLKALTERTRLIRPEMRVRACGFGEGTVRIGVEGQLEYDGNPLRLERADNGWLLPVSIAGEQATPEQRLVDDTATMAADVVVIDRERGDEWFVDRPLSLRVEPVGDGGLVSITGNIELDPMTMAGGRPLESGRHDLRVRVDALGLTRVRPLTMATDHPVAVLADEPRVLLEVSGSRRVFLGVGVSDKMLRRHIEPVTASWDGRRLTAQLAALWSAPTDLSAELDAVGRTTLTVGLARATDDLATWRSAPLRMKAGTYRVRLLLPGSAPVVMEGSIAVSGALAGRLARPLVRRMVNLVHRCRRRLSRSLSRRGR